ncbi:7730_t:CDS:2, partial [Ambispora leptoticha]
GHTKFKVDGNFGMIKKKYRKSTIYGKEDFVKVVERSSSLNKVQCYKDGEGFNADRLGVVKVKEFID